MVTEVNWASCGDYFAICTNIESLSIILEINITCYINYTSIKFFKSSTQGERYWFTEQYKSQVYDHTV